MRRESVTCDECCEQLNKDSGMPHLWALEMGAVDLRTRSDGAFFAVPQDPPMDRSAHFCGFTCLARWAMKRVSQRDRDAVLQHVSSSLRGIVERVANSPIVDVSGAGSHFDALIPCDIVREALGGDDGR